ncbi:LOW QUALITY PROTEIN: hypothetical protein NC653_035625 [Populus alba x Populus x berolinensis]|uniref:Uncharacterized protein n=1 Tax=Populus alba x Populus x berolinensis TaxID=444605 RepID=A0AAD6LHZ2_9ROSI|nr:LOW QUALITY PROTEIN: hypothetical protein NC653_035625 [Populus alba x Populus x berolinensis]
MRARDTVPLLLPTARPLPTTPQHQRDAGQTEITEYFKFKKDRDSPSEARGTLLVISGFGCNCKRSKLESALQEICSSKVVVFSSSQTVS